MLQFNMSLVYNIINLIVLCLLLKHFLIKPVLGIMDKRQAFIEAGLAEAKNAREEADALKEQYEAALKDARALVRPYSGECQNKSWRRIQPYSGRGGYESCRKALMRQGTAGG